MGVDIISNTNTLEMAIWKEKHVHKLELNRGVQIIIKRNTKRKDEETTVIHEYITNAPNIIHVKNRNNALPCDVVIVFIR